MNETAFRALVQQTLDAQKKYFKNRTVADLMEAKRLEAQVRMELAAGPDARTLVDGLEPGDQYSLFKQENEQ